jgi:hypothetical protein
LGLQVNDGSLECFILLQMLGQRAAVAEEPLCPLDISPKYDKEKLGCELSS